MNMSQTRKRCSGVQIPNLSTLPLYDLYPGKGVEKESMRMTS